MNLWCFGAFANGPQMSIANFFHGSVGFGIGFVGGMRVFAFFPVSEQLLQSIMCLNRNMCLNIVPKLWILRGVHCEADSKYPFDFPSEWSIFLPEIVIHSSHWGPISVCRNSWGSETMISYLASHFWCNYIACCVPHPWLTFDGFLRVGISQHSIQWWSLLHHPWLMM